MQEAIAKVLRDFADSVKAKVTAAAKGEPEAQLSGPASSLLESIGKIVHRKIILKDESALGDRLGIPDFGVVVDGALNGYVELKAPGHGADTARYKGRNKEQWERFKSQPNILYTDGNEWCLYQNGTPAEHLLRFSKDITKYGGKAVADGDVDLFRSIVTRLIAWQPIVPKKPKEQAEVLARLCRLLRWDVADALRDPDSPLVALAKDWRSLLFPDASDERFADAYAQTVTFALLLARSEGADVSDLAKGVAKLEVGHSLLSRALQVLTDAKGRAEIEPSLLLLQRVINAFPVGAMKFVRDPGAETDEDPWLYFYEHFLSAYDAKLRKDSGVYYTPVEVVKCQVALVDDLLRNKLNKPGGFTHKDVITLDPAVGTGTYPLGVIDHALDAVKRSQGAGAVAAKATTLAANIHGFERMTGPYAVSELRLTRSLRDRGASLPKDGLGVYLTDTLDSPHATPPAPPMYLQPIADQHRHALEVKDRKSVIVCLGNPPYDRHEAVGTTEGDAGRDNRARTGGWVRWGEETQGSRDGKVKYTRGKCILDDFIEPAKLAGHGGDLKNLYNLYIYFWRWAIWKVFEHPPLLDTGKRAGKGDNAGVVTFITAASYIRGDAFVGLREMLRRLCHEVYVIDLGGEGRGTRQDENVFNIQTPVAICIAVREGKKDKNKPAVVYYTRVRGTRAEKFAALAEVKKVERVAWKMCPKGWHAPLRPKNTGKFFKFPMLIDLMPWQQSGMKVGRLWPIAADADVLKRRWKKLTMAEPSERAGLFKNSPTGRKVGDTPTPLRGGDKKLTAISKLARGAACGEIVRYAYRPFDRQYILADAHVIDRAGPALWLAHSDKQIYLTSLSTNPLGHGPGLVAYADLPDLHAFRGSFGAKDTFPLYRDAAGKQPNILPGLLDLWGKKLKQKITPEAFVAYVYGLLAHPGYVKRFYYQLEDQEVRVPLTLNREKYCEVYSAGATLLCLHTYAARSRPPGARLVHVPHGEARYNVAISPDPDKYPEKYEYLAESQTLRIGDGEFGPIAPEVMAYEVSGLRVVESWLGYRMKDRKGKRSSSLDDIRPEGWPHEFSEELLQLLWIIEHTVAMHVTLAELLAKVCAGPLLSAADVPSVPDDMRRPPSTAQGAGLFGPAEYTIKDEDDDKDDEDQDGEGDDD